MKTKRTRWWLKSAALLCATVFGLTAFGGIHEWTPAEGGTTYWDDEANWAIGSEDWTDYRIGNNGSEVSFRSVITADDSYEVLFYNGAHTLVADEASFGLSKPNATLKFCAPWWFTGSPILNITSGTYEFGTVNVTSDATYNGSATLNLNGGTLTAPYVTVGADCTLTLNGGTLSATTVGGAGTLSVAGGTFANGENATVSATLSGSGTLTKTGAGTLAFTGSYAAFTGKIAVADGAGSVTVGDITIAAGEEFQFGVYTWTGAGTATTTTDEGTGVETTTYTDADLWSNVNNWLVNGSIPATAPAADSTVVIPAGDGTELSIRISGYGDCTGFLTINRDVKFVRPNSGTNGWGIRVSKVEGTGKLTLAGNNRGTPLGYDWLHIYTGQATDGEIIIDTDLQVEAYVQLEGTTPLRVNGAFSGGARFTCYSSDGQQGVHFHGDTSGFTGSYTGGTRASGSRDGTKFYGSALGSATGSWSFGGDLSTNAGYSPFKAGNDVTYKFGQLNTIFDGYNRLTFETYHKSSNSDYASNVTVEVGGRANSTSTVGGAINGTNNKIVKVGTTSTLNFTASESVGTVEAKEGTTVILGTVAPAAVKFAGTGATIKIARSTSVTTEVATGVEDDLETEEDESVTTETTTTDNIAASFVPTFIDDFAGYQYSVTQETADDVTYDVYTVVKVAKDSSDTEYYSVADAITALADAEDKTITLIANYDTAIALPLGYTLVMNNCTATVAGVAGVAVSYNEETGTYTTVDNSEATWQGAAAGANWADAANWSTGFVPNEGTKVIFNDDAIVFLSGCDNHDCGEFNIAQGKTVTLAPVDYNQENWPRVRVSGDITSKGECTLKLFRCGVDNAKADGSAVAVRPTIQFENNGTKDSWMTGSFDFASGLTGTGLFIAYGSNGAGRFRFTTGSITVPEGSVVDFRGGNYPTYSGHNGTISGGGLNGDGRVIIHTIPGNSTDRTYFQNAFKNANNWTGTCELAGVSISGIDAANYGNANSTVCFNGVSGYLRYSANSTTEVGKVKTIEIGANGLTLNNGFTSGTFGYIIAADITGSGPIHFGTRHNNAAVGQYFLTGSLDGFTGAIDFGDLQSYRPAVIIKDASTYAPAVNDYGQIIVAAERTVTVSGAWNAPGGFVVLGNVNVASTGSITSTNGLCGNGTVTYAAIPATAPGCFAGGTSSGTNREIPAWTGTVVLPARTGSGAVALAGLGRTGSKIVVNGITGTDANSIYLSDASAINGTVELKGDVKFTNGSTGANYTFAEVTGTGNMFLSATGSSGSPYYTYTFTKLTDYTGEINAVKTSDSKYAALAINTVAVSEVVPGTPVVKLAANSNLTTDPAAIALEVGGEATEARLFKADDGNLYVAVASVTVTPEEGDPVTTPFATYEAAAAFADENSVTEFTVLYGDGVMNGWDYDSAAGTLTKNTTAIARVGATQYDTLEAAFEAASAGDTVVLFGTSDEAVALAADGATLEIDTTATYTGALSGDGTVVANKDLTPVFSGWTGTFVMNWDTSAATSGTGWELGKYGVSGSTVVVAQPIANGYLKEVNKSAPPSIAPAVYLKANVSLTDGYAGSGQTTTFAELGADEGVTFSFRYLAGAQEKDKTYYTITKLNNFDGTLVLNPYNQVVVNAVELDATPAVGTKVVNATVDATASLTGKIADGYPLVFKADGLYFDPVAQVGEVYYNTLADAIAAANGAVVTLVQSTEEGYTFTGAGTVKIQFNGQTCGTIAAPEGAYVFSVAWQEETTTATYTCRVAAASASIGGVVTYYSTVQEAYLAVNANGSVGDSFTVLDGTDYGTLEGFSYDAETATYTKIATIAQFTFGVHTYSFTTLASACATAEEYDPIPTVTLLVALGEQTVPEGWEYNTPEASETEFGTLTKIVSSDIVVDTDGCDFTVDATTAAAIAAATGFDTTDANFGKAAIAYVVGGELEDGEVVIPTPTIKVSGTTVTVVYDSETANADAYTVTCTLYSFSLADANDSTKWTPVVSGPIGTELKDTEASGANKFYKVGVTITNKQLVSE